MSYQTLTIFGLKTMAKAKKRSNSPKIHHYVPQAQLRHFSGSSDKKFVYAFDKKTDRSFEDSISHHAGAEEHFNTIFVNQNKEVFEGVFEKVDKTSPKLISKIVESGLVNWLNQDDREALCDLFVTQYIRTRFIRESFIEAGSKIRDFANRHGINDITSMPSENDARKFAKDMFLNRRELISSLRRLIPLLYVATGSRQFVISDHPITLQNAFPYGDLGLESAGILLTLPLSPKYAITLNCPTILEKVRQNTFLDLEEKTARNAKKILECVSVGKPFELSDEVVIQNNNQQIMQSNRFIYSATDEFDFAKQFLDEHKKFRSPNLPITFSDTPPTNARLPNGYQIAVFGPTDHCLLPIQLTPTNDSHRIIAETENISTLWQLIKERQPLNIHLYENGKMIQMVTGAKFEKIGKLNDGKFEITYFDPKLRNLPFR